MPKYYTWIIKNIHINPDGQPELDISQKELEADLNAAVGEGGRLISAVPNGPYHTLYIFEGIDDDQDRGGGAEAPQPNEEPAYPSRTVARIEAVQRKRKDPQPRSEAGSGKHGGSRKRPR